MRAVLKAGTMVLMLAAAPVAIAVAPLAVFGVFTPVKAAMNADWPDSIDRYVMQVRKTVKTTDMDGYLAAVKSPNGAVLFSIQS